MNEPASKKEFLLTVDAAIDQLMGKRELSVTNVAQILGIHPQQLRRLILSTTGMRCLEYIKNYRVQLAKQILIDSDMLTIAKVGYKCGFEEATHFTRFFKRATGMTPSEFREQERDKQRTK